MICRHASSLSSLHRTRRSQALSRWFPAASVSLALLIGSSCASGVAWAGQNAVKGSTTDKSKPVLVEDSEVKLGRENAEENDRQVKLVTDAALVERVDRIGQEIAAVANSTPIPAQWGSSQLKQFKYTFKIVDDKDVNAYSMPGGFIYVNKGLLDYVRSDDELAGVLAHEISHAAHHHVIKLLHEQSKINKFLLPLQLLALGALIANPGANVGDAYNVWSGTQLYSLAKLNSYGVDAEKDADQSAIRLLTKTKYNPAGLYSFMLRMAKDEHSKVHGELGIFRTHPAGEERVAAAKQLLEILEIPILLSEVDPTKRAVVTVSKTDSSGPEIAEIKISGIVLCRVVGTDGMTAAQHGQEIAKSLSHLVDTQLQPFEIRVNLDKTRVLARGLPILTTADAAAQGKTVAALAHELSDAVTLVTQKRQLETTGL